MLKTLRRYLFLRGIIRSINALTRELAYYKEGDYSAYDPNCPTLARQRLDLLKHRHKLVDQYNLYKFSWMKRLL